MIPVLLFVYNRPYQLEQALKALALNEGAEDTPIFIYSDGAKNLADLKSVEEVRSICRNIHGFKEVMLIERERNYGLAENIISAINVEINKFGSVIVLEDDLITSPGFLNYMNDALVHYANSKIFSVCAYSPDIKIPAEYAYSTYSTPRIGSWGWGTWSEKWNAVDWKIHNFNDFMMDKNARRNFNIGGNDLTVMLLKQKQKKINSWAIRFSYNCYQQGGKVIYPVKSLVRLMESDGQGTHMKNRLSFLKYKTPVIEKIDTRYFCPSDVENEEIIERFRSFYSTSLFRQLINMLKINFYIFKIKRIKRTG